MRFTEQYTYYLRIATVLLLTGALLPAQTAPSKSVVGTVTGFKVDAHASAIMVKPDDGAVSAIQFVPETEVIRVAPGEHDLAKGEPARITEIVTGDRVFISFVQGMTEARRIVLVTATDIALRNEANRLDWQKRGVSGAVASRNGNQLILRVGPQTVTVTTTDQTTIRRYAPDSVRFADAGFSSVAQIAPGDQLQARGDKSDDGLSMTAQEVVFGTFLTKAGTITEVNPEANRVTIRELGTKQPLTIKLTADSRLRMVPDTQTIMNHIHGSPSPGAQPAQSPFGPGGRGMAQTIENAPVAKIEDLKPGGTVVVTGTKGTASDEITAIVFLANADFIVQMMQMQVTGGHGANGMPGMDEILKRHGMNGGGTGGGFSLPAIIP